MSFQIVADFENAISKFYGSPYAVAVDSCTHSIELCLRYKKIKKFTLPTRTYLSIAFLGLERRRLVRLLLLGWYQHH